MVGILLTNKMPNHAQQPKGHGRIAEVELFKAEINELTAFSRFSART